MTQIPGVILAGGLARRMGGGDKCLLQLGGKTILNRVVGRFSSQVGAVAINANGDPKRFSEYGLQVIGDTFTGHAGPLAGVLSAMEWAAQLGADQVATVAADTPFFPDDLVPVLAQTLASGGDISLAATLDKKRGEMRHPTFGLWPVDFREDLRRALEDGTRKVVVWTDRHDTKSALFASANRDPFFNINTEQDLQDAQAMLASQS